MNIGNRIKELRMQKGLSQEDLAVRANFSKSYIQKFEDGAREIKSSQLFQLSTALGVSITDIIQETDYNSDEFVLRNIEFREGYKILDVKSFEKRVILGDILHIKYPAYCKLEKLMNETIVFQNPLKKFEVITRKEQIEEAAIILRKKWKFENTPIYNLVNFLEDLGIKIFEIEEDEGFAGFSCWEKNTPIIVINIANTDIARRRFTILHELSHLLLRFNEKDENIEHFCNYFAGAMLLPSEALSDYINKSSDSITLEELKRIKSKYGISILAILVRMVNLDFISWNKYHEFKELYNSWKDKESDFGDETISRFDYLIAKGLREKIFSKDMASELSGISISQFNEDLINRKFSF
ncbi:helix-turn-helix domain-containing protein [Chryseobacterium bernardetii]|uniref:helix-turn-helix domain-containing protein n=1 Tax=Chryseobacterium bernardetii TaxID=1241978 RepID=UPI000F507D7B|nr:XRE family transcriptional regulator [Chryseobacterium bernardetii]AZB34257.1 ImmA/IrrE family metallo-endopeptidase [Chryseobacterium bernardetii]